jgi:hypothetical protein
VGCIRPSLQSASASFLLGGVETGGKGQEQDEGFEELFFQAICGSQG